MSTQIFGITIKRHRILLISTILISILLLWVYAATMDSMKDQAQALNDIAKSMPPEILKAFNVSLSGSMTFTAFLATKEFGLMLPIMLVIIATGVAAAALAGEIDKGTILLYLNQPISRARIYWYKYFTGLLITVAFVALSVLPSIPFALMYKQDPDPGYFFGLTLIASLFGATLYSIGFLTSAISDNSGRVTFVSIAVFLGSYIINLVSSLVTQLDGLKYISLMYYFDVNAGLNGKQLDPLAIPLFLVITVICALAGAYFFKRRDISIR